MSRLLEILTLLRDIEALEQVQGGPTGGIAGLDWRVAIVDATGAVISSSNPSTVSGNLTNNNAAPVATNLGVLPALANSAVPTQTEGDQVLLSTNLSGRLRTLAEVAGTTIPGAATPSPVGIGLNGTGGLLRNVTSALAAYPDSGNLLVGTGPGVFDGSNWQATKGNTRGEALLLAGGFTPAAPTCTFTRGANQTPYTIGDEVGTASTAPTTVSVGRFNGASGVIQGAQVIYSSYAATVPQLVLLLFSATVTLAGDNAQLNLSDAHAALLLGTISLSSAQTGQYSGGAAVSGGNTIFQGVPTAPIHFTCGGSEQTIYAALFTLNAFTPIANSETLVVTLQVEGN